jgi:hypothetical protein
MLAASDIPSLTQAIFALSVTMIACGASTLAGFSSVLQADLQKLSSSLSEFIPPELAQKLTDAINYAPTTFVTIGFLLAIISFAGCCGSLKKSRSFVGKMQNVCYQMH